MRNRRVPIVVPVFHRVADDRANDWTTSRSDFRQAIEWLREHFDLISLEEAQRRITSGENDRPSVSITFDDGYAANCDYAIPLLLENAIPCTYFVTSGPVLGGTSFDHDLAMGNQVAANTVAQLRDLAAAGIEIGATRGPTPTWGASSTETVCSTSLPHRATSCRTPSACPSATSPFPSACTPT